MRAGGEQGLKSVHTVRLVVEVVVVLGDVRDDAEPIGHLHGDHVFWIQQGRNPQLSLGHFKCLEMSEAVRNLQECKKANNTVLYTVCLQRSANLVLKLIVKLKLKP